MFREHKNCWLACSMHSAQPHISPACFCLSIIWLNLNNRANSIKQIQRLQTVHKWLTDYRPQYLQLLCGRVLYTIKTIAKTLRKLEMFQKKFMLSMAINRVRFINNHLVPFPVALSFSALFLKTPQKQKRDCVKSRMPMQCIQCIHSRH